MFFQFQHASLDNASTGTEKQEETNSMNDGPRRSAFKERVPVAHKKRALALYIKGIQRQGMNYPAMPGSNSYLQ